MIEMNLDRFPKSAIVCLFLCLSLIALGTAEAQTTSCLDMDADACGSSEWDGNQEYNTYNNALALDMLESLSSCSFGGPDCDIPSAREACYRNCLNMYNIIIAGCNLLARSDIRAICFADANEQLAQCQANCP